MSRKKINKSELNINTMGDRIKYLRLKEDLTQAQLSEKIGISKGNISSLENNRYEPSAKTIISLSELFNISTDWILLGNKEEKKENAQENVNIILKHKDTITRFKNPDKGLENNERLIDIEDADNETYIELTGYIKGVHNTVMTKRKEKQKIENKTTPMDPELLPQEPRTIKS